ncbi:MAG: hypothetical protein KAI09_00190, partial [Dehalococcoidales bacterium]|nr:hypothetical protein [Dehalococcoidales bacterium]
CGGGFITGSFNTEDFHAALLKEVRCHNTNDTVLVRRRLTRVAEVDYKCKSNKAIAEGKRWKHF